MGKPVKNVHVLFALVTIVIWMTSCGTAHPASSAQEVALEGVHLEIVSAVLDTSFPAGCTGAAPACTPAQDGRKILSVTFRPRDLPEGQMLAYKNLPDVRVTMEDGATFPQSLYKYDNISHTLMLGFQVPGNASITGLKWADAEIPLHIPP